LYRKEKGIEDQKARKERNEIGGRQRGGRGRKRGEGGKEKEDERGRGGEGRRRRGKAYADLTRGEKKDKKDKKEEGHEKEAIEGISKKYIWGRGWE
jgi:hypothetical protein